MTLGVWNSLGVVLVLAGTLLLFRYGAPFEVERRSGEFSMTAYTEDSPRHAAKAKRALWWQWGAVVVITVGSIIQVAVSLLA
ncbi:hypothetical protein D3C71_1910310 [compost metagenome]